MLVFVYNDTFKENFTEEKMVEKLGNVFRTILNQK